MIVNISSCGDGLNKYDDDDELIFGGGRVLIYSFFYGIRVKEMRKQMFLGNAHYVVIKIFLKIPSQ